MARVMTPNQELLTEYFWEIKTPPSQGLLIVARLWEEEATLEMLRYIQKTKEEDPAKLYEIALKISKKYETEENPD